MKSTCCLENSQVAGGKSLNLDRERQMIEENEKKTEQGEAKGEMEWGEWEKWDGGSGRNE